MTLFDPKPITQNQSNHTHNTDKAEGAREILGWMASFTAGPESHCTLHTCFVRKGNRWQGFSDNIFTPWGVSHRDFQTETIRLFQVNKKWKPAQHTIFQTPIPGNRHVPS